MADQKPQPDDEDDGEYELEPIDPAILERERLRAEERTRQAGEAVKVEQVLEETELQDPFTYDDLRGYRFQIRHLMIGTAVVAIVLTLVKVADCAGMFVAALIAVAAGWFAVLRKERRARLERQRRLAELETDAPLPPPPEPLLPVPEFSFAFSLRQLFAALTVAGVALGLVQFLGGPEQASILLGMIALLGLGMYAIGYELPPIVILGWWLLMVLYIAVSIWAAFATSQPTIGP